MKSRFKVGVVIFDKLSGFFILIVGVCFEILDIWKDFRNG